MRLREAIAVISLWILFHLHAAESNPSFGNEYVHIKVHVPKEVSAVHKLEPSVALVPKPKVVHHYRSPNHRRPSSRRKPPVKHYPHHSKLHGASVIVSEVKEPIDGAHLEYLKHADDIAEHLVEPIVLKPKKKIVNTYTIIEESKKVPKHHVETYKVIDSKSKPPKASPIETIKLIESKEPSHHYGSPVLDEPHYNYHARPSPHRLKPIYENSYASHELDVSSHYSGAQYHGDSDGSYHRHPPAADHQHHYTTSYAEYEAHGGASKPSSTYGSPHYEEETDGYVYRPRYRPSDYAHSQSHKPQEDYEAAKHLEGYSAEQGLPVTNYGPPFRESHQHHYHHHHNNNHDALYNGDSGQGVDDSHAATDGGYNYAPHQSPSYTSSSSGDVDLPPSSRYPPSETYSGIDSYSVGHVQGVDYGQEYPYLK